jgi:hypothetical protein
MKEGQFSVRSFSAISLAGIMLLAVPVTAKPAEDAHGSLPAAPHAPPAPRPPAQHPAPAPRPPAQHAAAAHLSTARVNGHAARDAHGLPSETHGLPADEPQDRAEPASDRLNAYHSTLNEEFAAHPGSDHGYWRNGWYHGYWHDYWDRERWIVWQGHYGFWLTFNGLNAFVYEYTPGVCSYWDGTEWVPWWNPPYTPYRCPF